MTPGQDDSGAQTEQDTQSGASVPVTATKYYVVFSGVDGNQTTAYVTENAFNHLSQACPVLEWHGNRYAYEDMADTTVMYSSVQTFALGDDGAINEVGAPENRIE